MAQDDLLHCIKGTFNGIINWFNLRVEWTIKNNFMEKLKIGKDH